MKKLLISVLVLMLVTTMINPAYGAVDDSKDLEKAILAAKEVVNISEDYTEFNSSFWREDYNKLEGNTKMWSLNWQDPVNNKSINVTVDENGLVRNFFKGDNLGYDDKPGKLSKQEGETLANDFLKKIMPEEYSDFRLTDYYNYGPHKAYYFNLYHSDYKVEFVSASVTIDGNSGEIREYYSQNLGALGKLNLPGADKILSKEAGEKAYIEKIGPQLSYIIYNDHKGKEAKSFPAYKSLPYFLAIDALTGELVNYSYFYGGYGEGQKEYAVNDSRSQELTPIEQATVDEVKGLLSQKEAWNALIGKVPSLNKKTGEINASLNKEIFTKKYSWSFYFESGSGSVDAKTGQVISFNVYEDSSKSKQQSISYERALKKARDTIVSLAPNEADKVEINLELTSIPKDSPIYYFTFSRIEKGLTVVGNEITVGLAKKDGSVISYNNNWNDLIKFEDVESPINQEEAFDIFDSKSNFGLSYINVEEEIFLVYHLLKDGTYNVDPVTKALLNYEGKPYRESKKDIYTDINGKWYEKVVSFLFENGHYLDRELFNGNGKINQEDFFRFLYSDYYFYDSDDFYKMLKDRGVLKEGEEKPQGLLTRLDASKFLVRHLGLAKAGEQYKIYINVFSDAVPKEYKGYVALAKSLGIVKGDKQGRLRGKDAATNAEAAVMIYNSLTME